MHTAHGVQACGISSTDRAASMLAAEASLTDRPAGPCRAQGRKSKLAGKAVAPAAEPQTSLDGPLSQQPYAAYMPQPEYSFDSCATSWSWPPSSAGVAAPQLAAAQQQPDAQPGTVLNHVGSFAQLLDCDASQPRTLAAPRQAAPVAAQQAAVGTTSAAAAAGDGLLSCLHCRACMGTSACHLCMVTGGCVLLLSPWL